MSERRRILAIARVLRRLAARAEQEASQEASLDADILRAIAGRLTVHAETLRGWTA